MASSTLRSQEDVDRCETDQKTVIVGGTMDQWSNRIHSVPQCPRRKQSRPKCNQVRCMNGGLQKTDDPAQPARTQQQQNAQDSAFRCPEQLPTSKISEGTQ